MENGLEFILLPGGVHLWGRPSSSLGTVPDDVVEQSSASYSLHPMDNPAWKKLSTDTIVVMGDMPDQALKVLAVTAEQVDRMLIKELGGPERRIIYKIRIFSDKGQFCAFAKRCGASTAASFYDPVSREMALHYPSWTDRSDFEESFAHELTHAYMDLTYGVNDPLWFAEGIAEYFSLLKWTRSGYKTTGKNWRAAMHLTREDRIPLSEVLNATREQIYGMRFPQFYAQSWSIIHFLLRKHPEIIDGLLHKQPIDLLPFTKEYEAYVNRLLG